MNLINKHSGISKMPYKQQLHQERIISFTNFQHLVSLFLFRHRFLNLTELHWKVYIFVTMLTFIEKHSLN
jgi:hypothetical protein